MRKNFHHIENLPNLYNIITAYQNIDINKISDIKASIFNPGNVAFSPGSFLLFRIKGDPTPFIKCILK
jgi:hypothetical protein